MLSNPNRVSHIVESKIQIGSDEPIGEFNSLTIHETLDGHHSFVLSMPFRAMEPDNETMVTSHSHIGKDFLVELRDATGLIHKYKGIVTAVNFHRSSNRNLNISISGTSPSIMLDGAEECRVFTDSSIKDTVGEVLDGYLPSESVDNSCTEQSPKEYLTQYRESAYSFLKRLAYTHGQWFYYNGEKLVFGEIAESESYKLLLGDDLYNYGINLRSIPLFDGLVAHDYKKSEDYWSDFQLDSVTGMDIFTDDVFNASKDIFVGQGRDISPPLFENKEQLEKRMQSFKGGLASQIQISSGTSSQLGLHIGTAIEIAGTYMEKVGSISSGTEYSVGNYTIIDITHSLSSEGNYSNNFSAIPDRMVHPPINIIDAPRARTQMAVVIENEDPDNLGRIRVRFPWMQSDKMTPWIRYCATHASEDRGFYFIPEIDDHVLVDFEGGEPDCPIVIASLYHKNAKPGKWAAAGNELKAIRTKSGNEVLFKDTSGEETIQIFNENQENMITLTLDGSKKIRIESKGYVEIKASNDIKLNANNILMEANEKITFSCNDMETTIGNDSVIDCGNNFELNTGFDFVCSMGNTFEVFASKNCEVSAGMDFKASGGKSAELDAMMTKVGGKTNLDLQGGAQATLKGGMVMIN